jgi:sn-glycerol 3-phosphate transport system substrate-binding protein
MQAYIKDFPPALVARDQLEFATAELSTYQNQRITTILNDGLEAAIVGNMTPEEAMQDAQKKAERILSAYR